MTVMYHKRVTKPIRVLLTLSSDVFIATTDFRQHAKIFQISSEAKSKKVTGVAEGKNP